MVRVRVRVRVRARVHVHLEPFPRGLQARGGVDLG